jgi:hypothetical protein
MGLVTVFYSLRFETCLFVASYDSQDHGGGIRTRLHTGKLYSKSNICYDRRSVGQSVLVSGTHLGLRPDFHCCQTAAVLLVWSALSDERTGLPFTIAPDPRHRSHSWVQVPWGLWPHFTLSNSRFPNLKGQVLLFISTRKRVAQLYPQALGYSKLYSIRSVE